MIHPSLVHTDMTSSDHLTNCLRRLRERDNLSVKDLAKQRGMHLSLIYKAENPQLSVRIDSLWDAYRPLCRTDDEWLEVLLRWALASCPGTKGALYRGKEILGNVLREDAVTVDERMKRIAAPMANVGVADFPLMERFIKEFAKNEHARAMVRAWLEAVGG